MSKSVRATSESAILDRLVEPHRPTMSPDAANAILDVRFPAVDIDRMNDLAEKARNGDLTPTERAEIENYERVGQFLSLLKSKARLSLRPANGRG